MSEESPPPLRTPAFCKAVFVITILNLVIGLIAAFWRRQGLEQPGYTSSPLIIVEFGALLFGMLLGLVMFIVIIVLFATKRWKAGLLGIGLGILAMVGWYLMLVLDAPTLVYMT